MQTHTHTQGPWTADISKNNLALSSVHCFGEIPQLMRPWNVAICTGPQAHSNAQLIAAAPDLLAALLRIVGEHADLGEIDLSTDEREALEQGRAAIRKAQGNA